MNAPADAMELPDDQPAPGLLGLAERGEGLDSCHSRAEDLHARLAELRVAAEPGWVHWYEAFERGFVLASTPLDVAEPLREFRQRTRAAWLEERAARKEWLRLGKSRSPLDQ